MSAGLCPLGDDGVDAGCFERLRLGRGGRAREHDNARRSNRRQLLLSGNPKRNETVPGWNARAVPQIADAGHRAAIAAGGIADARQLAAVLALGAGAAQIGTAFLACPESGSWDLWRQALSGASAESTTITRAFSGRPARAFANRATRELDGVLPYPAQMSLTGRCGGTTHSCRCLPDKAQDSRVRFPPASLSASSSPGRRSCSARLGGAEPG